MARKYQLPNVIVSYLYIDRNQVIILLTMRILEIYGFWLAH